MASKESGTSNTNISPAPKIGGWKLVNMVRIFLKGHLYFKENFEEQDSSVIKTGRKEVAIGGHKAAELCYEPDKVEKLEGFGVLDYNSDVLGGHVPNIFQNDEVHRKRKEMLMEYSKMILENLTMDNLFEIVAKEFEKIPEITEENYREFDIEDILARAVSNVTTQVLAGDIVDYKVMENFLTNCLVFKYSFFNAGKEIETAILKAFESAFLKKKSIIEAVSKSSALTEEELQKEIIWMVIFNAYGGIKSLVISALICLSRSEIDVELKKESGYFCDLTEKSFAALNDLKNLHSFLLEVLRLYPPAPSVYRRARNDTSVECASNGKHFKIRKGDTLSVKLFCVHRDATIHDEPDEFRITRDRNLVEENLYTFGDKFTREATVDNYKCIGQDIAMKILKVFIIFLLRCKFTPSSVSEYTGRNLTRLSASDDPIMLSTFKYNK